MRNILFFIILTALSKPFSFGQTYEQIYEVASQEVKDKLNNNKMTGQNILSGITAKHTLGLVGLTQMNLNDLETILNQETEIQNFTLNTDLHSIVVFCNSSFTLNQLKQFLEPLNISVVGDAVEYFLSTN